LAKDLNVAGEFEQLCKNQQIIDKVLEDMNKLGKGDGKLFSFELAKKITLDPIPFANRDLITPSFKLKRYEAKKIYKDEIDRLYSLPYEDERSKKVENKV